MTEPGSEWEVWKIIGLVLGSIVTALWGNSAWRRRASGDKVVAASSDGEVSLIARLNADIVRRESERVTDYARWASERNDILARADRLNEERNAAVEQIGALRQQVHELSTKVLELSGHVERLERIAQAHKDVAEGLRLQLAAFMNIHGIGGDKSQPPD